jgi:ATP-dependent Clp protease ATP-binding subunit ClpA
MFNRFTKGAGEVVTDAVEIAQSLGAAAVEAEHLLLAAARRDDATAVVLRGHGLDYDGLERALEAETERSLAAVGVTAERPRFTPFRTSTSARGTSCSASCGRRAARSHAR